MTALAVALVLCCAMVCGTVLALRRRATPDVGARLLALEAAAHVTVEERVKMKTAHANLSHEVEQLRASSAFRSLT